MQKQKPEEDKMTQHMKHQSHDISGVLDASERNQKIDRLNHLSNSFDKRNPSVGMYSERESGMNGVSYKLIDLFRHVCCTLF